MSADVTGLISWLRQWFDDIYAPKGQSGLSIDDVYPVGSIYMSANNVNPTTLFGGSWVQIKDRFLLAKGDTHATNGETGGEATHTLTTDEMPTHTHTQNSHNHTQNSHNHTQNSHNHTQNSHSHGTGNSTYNKFLASNINIAVNGTNRNLPSTGSSNHVVYSTTNGDIVEYTSTGGTTATNNAITATNNETTATNNATTATNQNTGGGQAHNNMPPYLVVNIWKRTA